MEILMAADNLCRIYKREGRRETVLSRVSLQLHTDEMIGIAGLSGSGKSTLVNLIPRFYECSEGTIRLFGQDIRSFAPASIRKHIGIVPQKAAVSPAP